LSHGAYLLLNPTFITRTALLHISFNPITYLHFIFFVATVSSAA